MTRPIVARHGLLGTPRPDPRSTRYTALDLARRRSLAIARQELEQAEDRGDPDAIVRRWRELVGELARAELLARTRP